MLQYLQDKVRGLNCEHNNQEEYKIKSEGAQRKTSLKRVNNAGQAGDFTERRNNTDADSGHRCSKERQIERIAAAIPSLYNLFIYY